MRIKKSQWATWQITWQAFLQRPVIIMFFLGFSAGLPLLLIFSSLSLWLREAGLARETVTYFSWAALGYSFKFVWAPLVDQLPIPGLTHWLGKRRAWLVLAQITVMIAIISMAAIDPSREGLILMALAAVLLGFASATQDIAIDAYRIESAPANLQALMSSTYIMGYRLAMFVSGAGALYLADFFGSDIGQYQYGAWQKTYWLMSAMMLVGLVTTLMIDEPEQTRQPVDKPIADSGRFFLLFSVVVTMFVTVLYWTADPNFKAILFQVMAMTEHSPFGQFFWEVLRFSVAVLLAWFVGKGMTRLHLVPTYLVEQTYIVPVRAFFERYGMGLAWLLLALIGLYRISDIVLGVISNVFYQDLGFSKSEIASVVKTFGVAMAIIGSVIGGIFAVRYGVMRILLLGAILSAVTNLLFVALSLIGKDLYWFTVIVAADNLAAGLANAAFIAFLSQLTNIRFTAMQYAIFSSLMTLLPKLLGGYSGGMVDGLGYNYFFGLTSVLGIPVIILIIVAGNKLKQQLTTKPAVNTAGFE